jgi:hypothetical protein
MKIAKYNPEGSIIWRVPIINKRNSDFAQPVSLAIDSSDNVYAFVDMYDTVFIGEILFKPGLYLLKFSSGGGLLWHANFSWQLTGSGLAADDKNNIIACLYARQDTSGLRINEKLYALADTVHANNQAYLVKFDSSGSILWAKNEVQSDDYGISLNGIAASSNTIAITGVFSNSIIIGDNTVGANISGYNKFIVAFDQNGNYVWSNQFGNLQNDLGGASEIVADNENNFYVLASCYDPTYLTEYFALAKYDPLGVMHWMDNIPNAVFSGCIAYSPYDHRLLITGWSLFDSEGNNDKGASWLQPQLLTSYNTDGDSLWRMATNNSDTGVSYWFVCADRHANYYLSGSFGGNRGDTLFYYNKTQYSNNIGTYTLTSYGGTDGFIAKLTNISASVKPSQSLLDANFIVYPNPATEKIKFLLHGEIPPAYSLVITDILGRELLKNLSLSLNEDISIHSLSPGIYYASISTVTERLNVPFIVSP